MFHLKILTGALLMLGCLNVHASDSKLRLLSDEELAATQGQALMSLSYIAPSDAANAERLRSGGASNIGFYRLGMEATLELNANIKRLQLGCGGTNGADGCDIDLQDVGLSGVKLDSNGALLPMTREERASSSAKLTNPFIEFAIKNPGQASTREVVGLRLSAEDALGLLTIGDNDLVDSNGNKIPNGINSLSGYVKTKATTGEVMTTPTIFGKASDQVLRGMVYADILLCTSGCGEEPYNGFTSIPGHANTTGLSIPSLKAKFNVPDAIITGQRMKSATIRNVTTTSIDDIVVNPSSGRIQLQMDKTITVAGLISVSQIYIEMNTKIKNLSANINFEENLGYLHNLPINGGGFYLGLQRQALKWPGAEAQDIAQPGWWMSFQNPLDLGYLQAPAGKTVDISSVYPQIANSISAWLSRAENRTNVTTGEGLTALFNGGLQKTIPDIDLAGRTAYANLQDVPLGTVQNVVANCYGTLKMC
ncbi:hypothetical protein F966_02080 [Acinetobacter higginsii]|uniref:Uncharacterized protein n=1 Tax=Acinetobacter higginsii TaxID=70347 RepID=N8XPP6_9GAMM|nr:hypothetical protein [Acinetobacter higginsii]ENV09423.1 hypothetical protein F966_02080 [Acinetobacter higginsii]